MKFRVTEAEEFSRFAEMSPEEQARIRAEVAERKRYHEMVRARWIEDGLDPDEMEEDD